jgi:uncharacterized protein (TIGR03435 family)
MRCKARSVIYLLFALCIYNAAPTIRCQVAPLEAGLTKSKAETSLSYDVIAIHPDKSTDDHFSYIESPPHAGFLLAHRLTMRGLILNAYKAEAFFKLTNFPRWVDTERFVIQAESDPQTTARLAAMSDVDAKLEKRRMLQRLLADRFKLAIHAEDSIGTVYELVEKSHGSAHLGEPLKNARFPGQIDSQACSSSRFPGKAGIIVVSENCSMKALASYLTMTMEADVMDRTGIIGGHSFNLTWHDIEPQINEGESTYPPLPEALSSELGLKLKPVKGRVTKWVVDHVEMPTPN